MEDLKKTPAPALALTVGALLSCLALPSGVARAQVTFRADASASLQVGPAPGLAPAAPPAPPPPAPPPAPPPVSTTVTVAPPPPVTVVVQKPTRRRRTRPRYARKLGLHGAVGGIMGHDTEMGGFTGAFRLRPLAPLAFDFGVGYYRGKSGGQSARFGDARREVPVSAELLFFVKSRRFLQLYILTGHVLSFSETWDSAAPDKRRHHHVYAHQTFGAGVELRFGRMVAINADLRGFYRVRLQDEEAGDTRPEYVEYENGRPTGRTADSSVGGLVQLGATLYF